MVTINRRDWIAIECEECRERFVIRLALSEHQAFIWCPNGHKLEGGGGPGTRVDNVIPLRRSA